MNYKRKIEILESKNATLISENSELKERLKAIDAEKESNKRAKEELEEKMNIVSRYESQLKDEISKAREIQAGYQESIQKSRKAKLLFGKHFKKLLSESFQ